MADEDARRPISAERNRRSWNAVTAAHESHKRDTARFLRDGGTTLFPEELELVGDVRGSRVLHAQCNCGQDSLGLAARGAQVVGVDIADETIARARTLAAESGIAATFERTDIIDWFEATATTDRRFDLVFGSYGVIPWIADLPRWMRGAAAVLAPGGRLVLMEFHPLVWSFDRTGRAVEPYFIDHPIEEAAGVSDYVATSADGLAPMGFTTGVEGFTNPEPATCYQWTVGEIVQAVIDAGFDLERFREYPYANGCALLPGMTMLPGRRFVLPDPTPALPLMLGLAARLRSLSPTARAAPPRPTSRTPR